MGGPTHRTRVLRQHVVCCIGVLCTRYAVNARLSKGPGQITAFRASSKASAAKSLKTFSLDMVVTVHASQFTAAGRSPSARSQAIVRGEHIEWSQRARKWLARAALCGHKMSARVLTGTSKRRALANCCDEGTCRIRVVRIELACPRSLGLEPATRRQKLSHARKELARSAAPITQTKEMHRIGRAMSSNSRGRWLRTSGQVEKASASVPSNLEDCPASFPYCPALRSKDCC